MDGETSVLVAGGGLVGLSAALFLADLGVSVTVVEQHRSTSMLPRGRSLSLRSAEVFRSVGVEAALRAAPPSFLHDLPEALKAETLAGTEWSRSGRRPPQSYAEVSSTTPISVDQNDVEPVLRREAERRGARLYFQTRLESFRDDGDRVTACVRDLGTGETRTVRAAYLIAADGHRSRIRETLGIRVTAGMDSLRYANIPFAADLSGPLRGRPLALCYLDRPAPYTILTRIDHPERWILMVPFAAGEIINPADCMELVHQAVGEPVAARLIDAMLGEDGQLPTWELTSWVADRYRAGRVLLVGDAAHVTPPAGGLGGNAGIQDAHNLAWKLAAVVRGQAGPALLDTYEQERQPIARLTADFSARLQQSRVSGQAGPDGLDPVAAGLGYRYDSTAVVGAPPGAVAGRVFDGAPGSRAPHHPIVRRGPLSTQDLYTGGFVLVAGREGKRWADAARSVLPVPVTAHRVGEEIDDPSDTWAAVHGVTDKGAVLVRPDGFVGWRTSDDPAGDPAAVLAGVLDRMMSADSYGLRPPVPTHRP